ncbi:hypothetical protein ACFSYG_20460, partial [Leeuwenhoekiella polynyae]
MKLKITLSLLGLFVFSGIFTANAQLKNQFDVRFSETLRGNFTTIGNNMLSRDSKGAYNGPNDNQDYDNEVYVDIDSDATTFNSSSADLALLSSNSCTVVKKVYLYWTAGDKEIEYRGGTSDNQPNWNYNNVKLKLPGQSNYTTYTADEVLYRGRDEHFSYDPYACVKDITAAVQALGSNYSGTYTVANVEAKEGTIIAHGSNTRIGSSAGWQIVVVYEDVDLPARNITLFDGFANVTSSSGQNNYDIAIDGFRTVPSGAVNADVIFGALEGDRGLTGDRLQVRTASGNYSNISTPLRPSDNFFNSRITRYGQDVLDRTPASTNTLGFDAGVFTLNNSGNSILKNNQTRAVFRLTSNQEFYSLYLLGLAVEVYEPELDPLLLTTSLGDAPTVFTNQEFGVSFEVKNTGNDDVRDLNLQYELPAGVQYLSADNLPSGVTSNYNSGNRTVTFSVVDNLVKDTSDKFSIGFRLKVADDCAFAGSSFNIQVKANYRGVLNSNTKNTLSSTSVGDSCSLSGNHLPVVVTVDPRSCEEYCSGLDTDNDGIPDNCDDDDDNDGILDADEGNASTAVLANPSQQTVDDLNRKGVGVFPLQPNGSKSLPSGGVTLSMVEGFKPTTSSRDEQQWRIYQPPPVSNSTININGGDVEFATKYLDLRGVPRGAYERKIKIDYGVAAQDLSNDPTEEYTYIIGIAGLGGYEYQSQGGEFGVDISSVPLRVIGNVDVYATGLYSDFSGQNPPEKNQIGNTISTSPPYSTRSNGYTFFYVSRDAASFEMEFKGRDPHGFIFGVLTETYRDTDGDGMVDSKDTDSDNDGCYDAIEAAGSFNENDLTTDFNLANTPAGVDADGVPTIAGSPQENTPAVLDKNSSNCGGRIGLIKIGTFNDENGDKLAQVGETIIYEFTVTNMGNVRITGTVIDDARIGVSGLTLDTDPLAPGASGLASAEYTITQEDI